MIEQWWQSNVWFAMALGVLAYAMSYLLAFSGAFLYNNGARAHITSEGKYEWSADMREFVNWRQFPMLKTAITLGVLALGIGVVWTILIAQYNQPEIFSFMMGGLILLELAGWMRQGRSIAFFYFARRHVGLEGSLTFSKRLTHTLSYLEFQNFALFYILIFLLAGGWVFLGGAVACFISSRRHRDWTVVYT